MLTKWLRAMSGSPERTDWESMLTHMGDESAPWVDSIAANHGAFNSNRATSPVDANSPDLNLALLGLSGDEVYRRARAIAKDLHAFAERGATVQQWNLLIRDVTALADMGQTMNSLAEVKLRRVKPHIKSIPMLPLMGSILAKRANDLRRSGVILQPQLQNCTIEGDPNICRALIETAIEWALPLGNQLTVKTAMSPWAEAAKVTIIAGYVVRTHEAAPPADRTSIFLWELINELALVANALISRTQIESETTLAIEFPVHNDNAGEIASEEVRLQMMDAPQLAKMDVVIFVQNQVIKLALEKALIRVDCRMRFTSSLAHLMRECELNLPVAIVVESEILDEQVRSLIADLRRHVRNFAAIEIIQAPNVFDIALPGSGNPCRLSATSIETNLADALRFELAQS
jgi:hypothetical protein